MEPISRRRVLQTGGAAAVALALQNSITKAAAVAPSRVTGSIKDVEHVVVMMQENRAFDHYFGTMRGVLGFGDPHPAVLPSGKSTFHQPVAGGGEETPFRPAGDVLGNKFIESTDHEWKTGQAAFNKGVYDGWVPAKGTTTMACYERHDIPWHFALADAFTVCDAYHCSVISPTDPNRYYMWTGWDGNDGTGGGPDLWNDESGYSWTTYPELLTKAGVSWKCYQDIGDGLTKEGSWGWTSDPYIGNFGDTSLLYFTQYQNAQPGSPLYEAARTGTNAKAGEDLFAQLRADVAGNKLPQVSYVVTPEAYSEHGNWPANYGAYYLSQLLDVLTSNTDVWSKTVLLIMYDENDGFFDHIVPPHPNTPQIPGQSTVSTKNEYYAGEKDVPGNFGLGVRVPMIVVSPWSTGGWVNSETFDHTSIIRFMEQRFGVRCPSISPWRRAVCGDLTSCFDFSGTNSKLPALPSAAAYKPADRQKHPNYPVVPPTSSALPKQEPGTRPARPLGYRIGFDASVRDGKLSFTIENPGTLGFHIQLRGKGLTAGPYSYTVGAGDRIETSVAISGAYDVEFHGPNGFYRRLAGNGNSAALELKEIGRQRLRLVAQGGGHSGLVVRDANANTSADLQPGKGSEFATVNGWYDLTVTSHSDASYVRVYAGHLEDGSPSSSNPLLGR